MTDTQYTDQELLERVSSGDEGALSVLFQRYRDKLFFYLVRHTKSPEIAEEIVTDIFMKLWTGRALASQIGDAAAFFHKVGYYKAMDFLRTTARHARLQQAYVHRVERIAEKQADELLIDAEARALLHQAILQLPPQRQLIYKLSRHEGLSHDEIAGALNLSRSTVNNTLSAATRSIVEYLSRHGKGNAALTVLFFL